MRYPISTSLILASALLTACGAKQEPKSSTQSSAPVIPDVQSVQSVAQKEPSTPPDPAVLAQAMADAFAKELGASMTAAFEEQARIQALGGTPEQIAEGRARFDQVQSSPETDTSNAWMVPCDLPSASAEAMPVGLLEGSGLECNFDGADSAFRKAIDIDLEGMTRAQAIETIASRVGMVPIYPKTFYGLDQTPQITFEPGPRANPVTFVGPFVLEVASLEETAPHTVGKLELCAHAVGLTEAVLASNQSMAEWVRADALVDPDGNSLKARPNVQQMSQPQRVGGVLRLSWDVDLGGLLRSVDEIALVEGTLSLNLPVGVEVCDFDGFQEATRKVGPWTVQRLEYGSKSKLEVRGADADHLEVLWSPESANMSPLGIVDSSLFGFGTKRTAQMSTSETPARIRVKLVQTETVTLPFRLEHIPLKQSALQPESREELRFKQAQPVSVVFVDFQDKSGDFPTIQLRSVNHCNKDANSVQVKLIYLDGQNQSIGDCFTSLTAPMSFDQGPNPFLAVDVMQTSEQVAFFMPKETVSVQVAVVAVDFVDGTHWEAAQ